MFSSTAVRYIISPKYQYKTFSNLSVRLGVALNPTDIFDVINGNALEKYCDGAIPAVANEADLSKLLSETAATADKAMCALDFQGGILAIMDFCKRINLYVTETEPWVLAKDEANRSKLNEVLYNTAEGIRALAVLLHPVMPETCEKLWENLGANSLGALANQKISEAAKWGTLPAGSKVSKSAPLFPRLEE